MSSIKCRCGSDDKCRYVGGKIVRISDGKPHICLGQEVKQEQTKSNDFLEKKQKEIKKEQAKPIPKEYVEFCEQNYPRINAFRKWVLENDSDAASNGQALGMIVNNLNLQWIQEKVLKK